MDAQFILLCYTDESLTSPGRKSLHTDGHFSIYLLIGSFKSQARGNILALPRLI